MHVTRVTIEEYKHVRACSFVPLPGLNILTGKNNSGKTNILEAIDALTQPLAAPGSFTVTADDEGREVTYHNGTGAPPFVSTGVGRIAHVHDARFARASEGESFFRTIVAQYRRVAEESERAAAFTSMLKTFFPHLTVTIENDAPVFHDEETLPIERMGSGFHQVFTILVYLYNPDVDIVLVDEPESHLHPSLIERLRDAFIDAADRGKQIFLSTHSPLFVTPRLLPHLFRVVRHPDRVEMFPTVRTTLDADRLVQEITPDVGEAFFADKVLLLEGVADRILMEGLIERFALTDATVKVIDVGGKDNVTIYRDLCRAFGIRYYVMLDRDAIGRQMTPLLQEVLGAAAKLGESTREQIAFLKTKRIFVLPDGPLERHYPRKYQRKETKPLQALNAARNMSKEEYALCMPLREIIEAVEHL